ncbi:entericidin A/B family lipoprotein [Litorimonas sp. RW-G-Af-16]|uniref:entericidin A/B family lipoprotein n=1 Tax=Litorimonas sp. RW-G-Af-16 TaxID=3241168 RepID=UPI00390CCB50
MTNSKTKAFTAIILSAFAMLAAACNTVEGVGQDLESAGDAAERTTDEIAN